MNKKMQLLLSTILGFIFGIVACWAFWKYLLWQRPKVAIADKIAVETNDANNSKIYRFKITNKGSNQVVSITLKAWICDLLVVAGGQISRGLHELPISNSETVTLAPKGAANRPWGLTPERIFRCESGINIDEIMAVPNRRILVTLRVTDAISGTTAVQQISYDRKDILQGNFAFGESFEIT
jgi:hypothetical protein